MKGYPVSKLNQLNIFHLKCLRLSLKCYRPSLQRWQHRVRNETKHFVSPHLIGPQFLANQHETNQHKSAVLIGLFHVTSSVLLSVESYRNYRKPTQRGVQGYLSSLQRRVHIGKHVKFLRRKRANHYILHEICPIKLQ